MTVRRPGRQDISDVVHGLRWSLPPGSVVQVADGQQTSPERRGQRPPAPHIDGPLASSGAAPEAAHPATAAPAGSQRPEAASSADTIGSPQTPDKPDSSAMDTAKSSTEAPENSAPAGQP